MMMTCPPRSFPSMRSARNKFPFPSFFAITVAAVVAATAVASAQTVGEQEDIANMATAATSQAPPANFATMPAKKLFGQFRLPDDLSPQPIGSFSRGCMSGGASVPINGPAWQVMRLSRNRNWGHPKLVALVKRLAIEAKASDGWNGLLVGDLSQPRGGPMKSGHASHQIGLDADIWLTPMPDRLLTAKERENMAATVMTKSRTELNYAVWTESRARLIKRAAQYPEVARIFVHPPIKAELCRWAKGDRSWLAKVRAIYGHNYHFHIRMKCPPGAKACKEQWAPKPKDGTGCGEELAYWMSDIPWRKAKPNPNAPKLPPPPPLTLSGLPAECRAVVTAP
jgi:penicillin-insensitive murein DD-endopeptidase